MAVQKIVLFSYISVTVFFVLLCFIYKSYVKQWYIYTFCCPKDCNKKATLYVKMLKFIYILTTFLCFGNKKIIRLVMNVGFDCLYGIGRFKTFHPKDPKAAEISINYSYTGIVQYFLNRFCYIIFIFLVFRRTDESLFNFNVIDFS